MSALINASTSSGLVQTADTSGTLELQSNGTTQLTVSSTGAYGQLKSGTALATTSGTGPFTFTGIPSWVKRITVQFSGIAANGSLLLVQIGSGSYTTSGYVSGGNALNTGGNLVNSTAGFYASPSLSTGTSSGNLVLTNITGNTWVGTALVCRSDGTVVMSSGFIALGGVLDRLQVTTVTGTATFSSGSTNILYEG